MSQVAEVEVAQDGTVRVLRIVCAVDCSIVVNPDTIAAQVEGGSLFGLTAALYGAITLNGGRVEQSNFHDYRPMRMNEVPVVETHIVKSMEAPGGFGEAPCACVTPAVTNAIFAVTGTHPHLADRHGFAEILRVFMNAHRFRAVAVLTGFAGCLVVSATARAQEVPLQSVSAFATIDDEKARSVALFTEAAKVIQSPRCMNCHPATRQPTQGDDLLGHVPDIRGGAGDHGPPGLPCNSCHGATNVETLGSAIKSIPGNPRWSLAPASMAWQGKTLHDICIQITDRARNGGRSVSEIHQHMATDPLVGWAWHPGEGRMPAPGTQAAFGALIEAWISAGADCP